MADDPINIVVTDNIDPNVDRKLNAIANSADKGTESLTQLRAALAAIRGENLTTLQTQAQTATQQINAELAATNALGAANKTAQSSSNDLASAQRNVRSTSEAATTAIKAETAALEAQRQAASVARQASLDAQIAARAAASAGGSSAAAAAAGAPIQLTRENPSITLTPGGGAAAGAAAAQAASAAATAATRDMNALGAATATAGAAVGNTERAIEDIATRGPGFFTRLKTSGVTAFDAVRDAITANGTRFRSGAADIAADVEGVAASAERSAPRIRGGSTAIRELLVIAREGGRGDFNRMAGSVSILATAVGLLPIVLTAAAAGFIALSAARTTLNTEAEQTHLKEYAESLGLSEKEMRKLKDTTVDANGQMHEHNLLQVTYGDVFRGTVTTIREGIGDIAKSYGITTENTRTFTVNAITFLKAFFSTLVGGIGAFINFLYTEAVNLVTAAQNVGTAVGNAIALTFESLVQGVIEIINGASTAFNAVSSALGGPTIGMIKDLKFEAGDALKGFKAFRGEDFFADIRNGAKATNDALDATGKNILKAADARVKAEADAIKANRNPTKPKKEADPKTQDDYLDDENLKLDNQIKLFGMLRDARDVQQQLDQIQESFAKRRMPLDAAQIESFRAKIALIQQQNKVQAEMDKIYSAVTGPQEAFNIGQAALNKLLQQGNIGLADYQQQMVLLQRTLASAKNPLFALQEGLEKDAQAIGLTAEQTEQFNNAEKVRQALLAKGIILGQNATKEQVAEAKAVLALANANDQKKYVADQVKSVTDTIVSDRRLLANKKAMYAEIARQEKAGILTHRDAEEAKYELSKKFDNYRKENFKDTLSTIASLASSGNQTLAAIGKAAAVAEATIDGIAAVQKALKSAPPPLNFVLAAAVGAVTAVNVSKIISTPTNVGSYWTGGDFIVRGKTGVDSNRIAMNVSDGERVTIQTQAQQAEARRASNDNGAGKGDTHVNNFFDEKSFVAAMDSQAGERVVMNIISRRKKEVKGTIK